MTWLVKVIGVATNGVSLYCVPTGDEKNEARRETAEDAITASPQGVERVGWAQARCDPDSHRILGTPQPGAVGKKRETRMIS